MESYKRLFESLKFELVKTQGFINSLLYENTLLKQALGRLENMKKGTVHTLGSNNTTLQAAD